VTYVEFRDEPEICKTRVFELFGSEEIMTLALFVLMQYQSVTDGRTDRQTDISALAIPGLCYRAGKNVVLIIVESNETAPNAARRRQTSSREAGEGALGAHYDEDNVVTERRYDGRARTTPTSVED